MDAYITSLHPAHLVRPYDDPSVARSLAAAVTRKQLRRASTVSEICRSVVKGASSDSTALAEQLARGIDVLNSLPKAAQNAVVFDPAFNFWLHGIQQLIIDGQFVDAVRFGQHLPSFLWATDLNEQLRAHQWVTTLDDRGGLRMKPAGGFIEFGAEFANKELTISYENSKAVLKVANGPRVLVPLPFRPEQSLNSKVELRRIPTLPSSCVECSSRDPALRVAWLDPLNRTAAIELFGVSDRQFPTDLDIAPLHAAWSAVFASWPSLGPEFELLSRAIVPMDSGPGQRMAVTLPSRNGAIFMDMDEQSLMEEAIVHEHGHIKLRYIQDFDPFICGSNTAETFPVPWRRDPRPLAGIFEAVFVYLYVAEYAIRRALHLALPVSERPRLLVSWVHLGVEILQRHAHFTPVGEQFIHEVVSWQRDQERRCGHSA